MGPTFLFHVKIIKFTEMMFSIHCLNVLDSALVAGDEEWNISWNSDEYIQTKARKFTFSYFEVN